MAHHHHLRETFMQQLSTDEAANISGAMPGCHIVAGAWGTGLGLMIGSAVILLGGPVAGLVVTGGVGLGGYAVGVAIFCEGAEATNVVSEPSAVSLTALAAGQSL
jgi:hypothetical protein